LSRGLAWLATAAGFRLFEIRRHRRAAANGGRNHDASHAAGRGGQFIGAQYRRVWRWRDRRLGGTTERADGAAINLPRWPRRWRWRWRLSSRRRWRWWPSRWRRWPRRWRAGCHAAGRSAHNVKSLSGVGSRVTNSRDRKQPRAQKTILPTDRARKRWRGSGF